MKKILKKSIYVFISLVLCLVFVSSPVLAARSDGEIIFAKDLAVGEIVTVQIATGTNADAMVVNPEECPRLVLLINLGSDVIYRNNVPGGYDYTNYVTYDLSNLKNEINSRTSGHADYIFNISAPFLDDILKTSLNYIDSYNYKLGPFDGRLGLGGSFWTRSSGYNEKVMCCLTGYMTNMVTAKPYSDINGCGVRPAFNLKSDTILKYNSAIAKYTVTTAAEDLALAFFQANGFDSVIYVPQGQTPAGYTALTGYTGVFYKQINNRFLFVYVQEYTPPTSVGSLNIN